MSSQFDKKHPNKFRTRLAALKTDLPAIWLALKDPETPVLAKALAALTIAYALSPIDLIPDWIPVLGYLDDILILPVLIALTVRLIPPNVWARSRESAKGLWQDGKPKKWYYAVPIVAFWAVVVVLVVRAIAAASA